MVAPSVSATRHFRLRVRECESFVLRPGPSATQHQRSWLIGIEVANKSARRSTKRTYWRAQRSMARRQRWRSVATGRQRRQAWISFSSPRRDARGDEIGEIDSRVAKRILYEFESEFVNFVVRKVTRGALSGSIGACGGVWGGRLVSGRREASAHSPNLIKNMGFFPGPV